MDWNTRSKTNFKSCKTTKFCALKEMSSSQMKMVETRKNKFMRQC